MTIRRLRRFSYVPGEWVRRAVRGRPPVCRRGGTSRGGRGGRTLLVGRWRVWRASSPDNVATDVVGHGEPTLLARCSPGTLS